MNDRMQSKKAAVGNYVEQEKLLTRIEEAQKEMDHLSGHLRASILIEAIWPRAFDHGSVRFSGIQRYSSLRGGGAMKLAFTEAWFENSKTRYYLSRDDLRKFKPEAVIHPHFSNRERES